ncbi:hypothetical protein BGZ51_002460 [Haplosporangium sp. Z 767]|nr:hypothetical protein BGZ51_002460 [Haplosporangium sp. Z 767]
MIGVHDAKGAPDSDSKYWCSHLQSETSPGKVQLSPERRNRWHTPIEGTPAHIQEISPRCRSPLFPNEAHLLKSHCIDRLSKYDVEVDDRKLLDRFCSRVLDGDMSDDGDDDDALNVASALADEGSNKRPDIVLLLPLLHCVYDRTPPANTKSSDDIESFLDKIKDALPTMSDPGKIKEKMEYPASCFLRSTAVTMATAMKRHYRKGSQELAEKTRTLMDKGNPPANTLSRIDSNIPVLENFVRLNKITEPGYLINTILTDVGGYCEDQRKEKRGYWRSTMKMSVQEMRHHFEDIRDKGFSPVDYSKRGYVLWGPIRTDELLLQLLAFKMKELNAVKYRRLDENKLPSRLNSIVGGMGYSLSVIRNIVQSKEDVERLWGCDPDRIKVLGFVPG